MTGRRILTVLPGADQNSREGVLRDVPAKNRAGDQSSFCLDCPTVPTKIRKAVFRFPAFYFFFEFPEEKKSGSGSDCKTRSESTATLFEAETVFQAKTFSQSNRYQLHVVLKPFSSTKQWLRIRDVHPGSRICIKEFKYFNPKNGF